MNVVVYFSYLQARLSSLFPCYALKGNLPLIANYSKTCKF